MMKKIEMTIPKKFRQATIVATVGGEHGNRHICKFINEEEMDKDNIVEMVIKGEYKYVANGEHETIYGVLNIVDDSCELCSNIIDYKDFKSPCQWEDIFYDSEKDEFILIVEQFRYEYTMFKIKYCPECGRLLG